jgi:acetylglutamate kinase
MIKDETINSGMIPKVNACLTAVNNGVTAAGIINGTKQHSCLWEIFSSFIISKISEEEISAISFFSLFKKKKN